MQLPRACVTMTDARSFETANSPMPTTIRRRGCAEGGAVHISSTEASLIDGGRNPAQAVGQSVQAFGVRDEQQAARLEMPLEHRDDALLHLLVEVNHHVA